MELGKRDVVMHNTIAVYHGTRDNEMCIYWQDNDGNNSEFICHVYGFENAIRVANGIAHEQAEYVKHPGFNRCE